MPENFNKMMSKNLQNFALNFARAGCYKGDLFDAGPDKRIGHLGSGAWASAFVSPKFSMPVSVKFIFQIYFDFVLIIIIILYF